MNDRMSWLALLVGVLLVVGLVAFSMRSRSPLPADAPEDRFSAERAMEIVRYLSEEIGMRPNGSPAHERAAEYLAAELRELPGVEVELQRVASIQQHAQTTIPFPPFVYQTLNVVARIEGESPDAVLLNAHYDTLTEGGTGAGDDGMGVAAIVEAARALASGPKLRHSVVVLLNGAEEVGLLGASGFLEHRYAKDVKAYIYPDGGPAGKPLIIGAGPGNAWLLDAFTGAAPAPAVTVVAQDVIDSGMLPHSGDFVPFHEAGIPGIDLAPLGDFWAIHTSRDVPERVDLPTLQLLGQSLLDGARGLAGSELPGNVDDRRLVYHDVATLFVLDYPRPLAVALALVAVLLVAVGLVLARRRGVLSLKQELGAFGRVLAAAVSALLAALLVAALLGLVLGRPHGWFSAPWVAVLAFGAPALAAALAVSAIRRRDPPETAPLATWAGALLLWALWLVLATLGGAGSGYLALWFTGFGAIGFIAAVLRPGWRPWVWLVAWVPGAVLTLELMTPILPFAVADVGLVPAPAPLDMLIGLLVGVTVLVLVPLGLVPVAGVRRLGWVAIGLAALAVAGVVVAAVHAPYTAERPKRVRATVAVRDGEPALLIGSGDALPVEQALTHVSGVAPIAQPWAPVPGLDPPFTHRLPAAAPDRQPPRIEIVSSSVDQARGSRRVRLRLVTEWPRLRLYVPTGALRGWSLGEVPERSIDPNRMLAIFENASPAQREIELELAGEDPVEVELIEVRGPSRAPEMEALRRRLPPWVALDAQEVWSITQAI